MLEFDINHLNKSLAFTESFCVHNTNNYNIQHFEGQYFLNGVSIKPTISKPPKSSTSNDENNNFLSYLTLVLILWCTSATCTDRQHDFVKCLQHEFDNFSNLVYTPTPTNSSFLSILRSTIQNQRFATDATPTPQAIITPDHESQIPPLIRCATQTDLQIRTRSGGHDFEGLSYVAQVPFVIIDLINLSEITVDAAEKTA